MIRKMKESWLYVLIFILSLAVNLSSIGHQNESSFFPDSMSYVIAARQINNGEWPDFSFRTPTYPIFLSLFTANNRIADLPYVCAILGAITTIVVLWVIRELTASIPLAMATILLVIFNLGVTNYQSIISTESIAPALVMFCLAANLIMLKNDSRWIILATIIADISLMFLKPTFIVAPLILKTAYLIVSFFNPRIIFIEARKRIMTTGVVCIVAAILFLGYNYWRTGTAKVSTVESYNLLGKIINYGYLDSAKVNTDTPTEVKKLLEIYRNNSRPESPHDLLNLVEMSMFEKYEIKNKKISKYNDYRPAIYETYNNGRDLKWRESTDNGVTYNDYVVLENDQPITELEEMVKKLPEGRWFWYANPNDEVKEIFFVPSKLDYNRKVFLDRVNKYFLQNNKFDFVVRTIFLIPNNINVDPEIYVKRPDWFGQNPVVEVADYIHRNLNASKVYVMGLSLVVLFWCIGKKNRRSLILGSILLWSLFLVIANSAFGYISFGRLRQPTDLFFDIFIFVPFFFKNGEHKSI